MNCLGGTAADLSPSGGPRLQVDRLGQLGENIVRGED